MIGPKNERGILYGDSKLYLHSQSYNHHTLLHGKNLVPCTFQILQHD